MDSRERKERKGDVGLMSPEYSPRLCGRHPPPPFSLWNSVFLPVGQPSKIPQDLARKGSYLYPWGHWPSRVLSPSWIASVSQFLLSSPALFPWYLTLRDFLMSQWVASGVNLLLACSHFQKHFSYRVNWGRPVGLWVLAFIWQVPLYSSMTARKTDADLRKPNASFVKEKLL